MIITSDKPDGRAKDRGEGIPTYIKRARKLFYTYPFLVLNFWSYLVVCWGAMPYFLYQYLNSWGR
jgi:hypothetical protein